MGNMSEVQKFSSLEMYPVGSVWIYANPYTRKADYKLTHKNHDFITSRMVVIVSEYTALNARIQAVPITSNSLRPGFDCFIPKELALTDVPCSRICPYDMVAVGPEYLKKMIGMLDHRLVQAVRDSIAWHMGYSEVLPPYINPETEDYIRIRNPVTFGSREDQLRMTANGDRKTVDRILTVEPNVVNGFDETTEDLRPDEIRTKIRQINDSEVNYGTMYTITDDPDDRVMPKDEIKPPVKAKTPTTKTKESSTTPGARKRYNNLSMEDLSDLLSLSVRDAAKKFNVTESSIRRWKGLLYDEFGHESCAKYSLAKVKQSPKPEDTTELSDVDQFIADVQAKKINIKFLSDAQIQVFLKIDPSRASDLGIARSAFTAYVERYSKKR